VSSKPLQIFSRLQMTCGLFNQHISTQNVSQRNNNKQYMHYMAVISSRFRTIHVKWYKIHQINHWFSGCQRVSLIPISINWAVVLGEPLEIARVGVLLQVGCPYSHPHQHRQSNEGTSIILLHYSIIWYQPCSWNGNRRSGVALATRHRH